MLIAVFVNLETKHECSHHHSNLDNQSHQIFNTSFAHRGNFDIVEQKSRLLVLWVLHE